MKRNSWLMIAYIIFIFISSIIRLFYVFPMWESLVIAVTVSTSLFTYADVFLSLADSLESQIKSRCRLDRDIQEQIAIEKPITEKLYNDAQEITEPREAVEKIKRSVIKLRNLNSEIEEVIEDNKKSCWETRKKINRYNLGGAILSIAGFVLFLCILVYEPLKLFFIKKQDILTVTSFALVLSTQFIRDHFNQMMKHENEIKEQAYLKFKKHVDRLRESQNILTDKRGVK